MVRDKKIQNALKRSEVHRKTKREKEQVKLKRRMEIRKAERAKDGGAELKAARLAKNVPRTVDNTRMYDSSSYLTSDPAALRAAEARAAEASRALNATSAASDEGSDEEEDGASEEDEEGDEDDKGEDEDMEAGPSTAGPSKPRSILKNAKSAIKSTTEGDDQDMDNGIPQEGAEIDETPAAPAYQPPPRIMITTSPSPCKETYDFCEDLRGIFPGGEFFKRPKGKGFEIGRIGRWAAKRGYGAVLVVNENHKTPTRDGPDASVIYAITVMNLPAGPTAYFKLTSTTLGKQIYGHARPTPHSPELILNNFTTLLGHSIGRLFGSLFPPQPQFRGRQVVTLHNQRDFLFFRRHRYAFTSPTQAKLQEIGPRFTLKLRWLRKGLPAVTARDGHVLDGANGDGESDEEGYGAPGDAGADDDEDEDEDMERQAMEEMGQGKKTKGKEMTKVSRAEMGIPALDEEQEYEWKWTPKMGVNRRMFYL